MSGSRAAQSGRTWRRVASLLVMGALLVSWTVLLRPQAWGGTAAYIMVSGNSMEPTYHTADFVLAQRRPSYDVGDIVVYVVPQGEVGGGSFVVHRIIGGSAGAGYELQGDNRDTPDTWRPTISEVVGEAWILVPSGGKWLATAKTPFGAAALAGLVVFLMLIGPDKEKGKAAPGNAVAPLPRPPAIRPPALVR